MLSIPTVPPDARDPTARVAIWGWGLAGLAAALPAAILLRDFTVDDALIVARYAHHLQQGVGMRFNPGGAPTDGVTPLGYAHLLAALGGVLGLRGPLPLFELGRWLGAAAWCATAIVLGLGLGRLPDSARTKGLLLLLGCSVPLGAWAWSGLETSLVTATLTLALVLRCRGRLTLAAGLAGLAAAWRPELLPFVLLLARVPALGRERAPRLVFGLGLGALPAVALLFVRVRVFGEALPLSWRAKPPDFGLGVRYALACLLLTGGWMGLAPRAWRSSSATARGLGWALGAHVLAVVYAGGDWMPLSRLFVPVLPSALLWLGMLAPQDGARSWRWKLVVALLGELFVGWKVGPAASKVGAARRALIEEARPPLEGRRRAAGVDVGWLGVAFPGPVVDLAGVTDPSVARLPGGHTSKRLTAEMLDARQVDTLVLLLAPGTSLATPWTGCRFARSSEARLARLPGMEQAFEPLAMTSTPGLAYLILRRTRPRIDAPSDQRRLPDFAPEPPAGSESAEGPEGQAF